MTLPPVTRLFRGVRPAKILEEGEMPPETAEEILKAS
jgi:hypothetical protein